MASNILGGFEGTVYTAATINGAKVNRGVITRFNPALDPGNLPVRGTGERGLYDILIGRREPVFSIDFLPSDSAGRDWIAAIQGGTPVSTFLHLYFESVNKGLTFEKYAVNRLSLEAREGEIIRASAEFWAGGGSTWPVGIRDYDDTPPTGAYGGRATTPYRWLDSVLDIGAVQPVENWWSWRYEVNNNLQRLGDVSTGGTRDIKPRQRDVSGLIVMDLEDFAEYGDIADIASEMSRFNITITLDTVEMLNCDRCRWGRLEAPSGPEDLIAKRFPFTATDLTTLTP